MFRRYSSLILVLLLIICLFSGCGKPEKAAADGSAAASRVTAAEKTTTASQTTRSAVTAMSSTASSASAAVTTETAAATTEAVPQAEPVGWTILEYLCGTDLETEYGAATENLEEIIGAHKEGAEYHYVIETGGTKEWKCGVDSNKIQRWYLENGQLMLANELELASMGAPKTLSDFLSWGVENFPAEHYMLIIWDHGGGCLSGVVFDELFGNDSLTMGELDSALSDAGVYLDVLGFDACLMANLETAATVAPYADYMIASEESIPSSGWDYGAFTECLEQNPYIEPEDFSMAVCDAYLKKCTRLETRAMATLSVLDLNKVDSLVLQFGDMAREMETLTTDINALVSMAQSSKRAENYGGQSSNLIDLGDLILEARDVLPQTADETLNALLDTVIYHVSGENRAYGNGLSVFYPLDADYKTCNDYENVSVSDEYLHYISAVVSEWNAPPDAGDGDIKPVRASDYNVEMTTWLTTDSSYMMGIMEGQECVEQVLFNMYYADQLTNSYILMGKDDDIIADWDEYTFRSNMRGIWMSLNGCYCAPQLLAQEKEYNLYSIPILLNGVRSGLRVTYTWADRQYRILGVFGETDEETGMAGREIRPLQNGDEVSPLFEFVDMDTGESYTDYRNTIHISGEPVLEEIELFDGDYLYEFEVRDVFGKSYYSEPITITCEGGNQTLTFRR